ncbi:alkaline-phosphatase-like protein [Kalaharituber pfeilii]|nr:alkaline-phosphatase-like protein [Kalaharituber pfeilii]
MARDYVHWSNNNTVHLPIDELLIGSIRTRSSDSFVTDSSSSATAYSCGIKTLNGAVGVNDDNVPCGTVLEAAKAQGFKTGLVVTSRITHATPASYVAHVWDRDEEANIALQEIGYAHPFGPQVDILMGGGRCFFIPQSESGSCRDDDINALKIAEQKYGFSVFLDRAGFDKKQKLPYLGLFTMGHMSYEIDRDAKKEPSLTEMSIKALDDLYAATKSSKKGFFIMIEASRIDHAGHANDPAGHVYDILEYNNAMKAITQWIDRHSDSPTIMISNADHECGGLTLAGKVLDSSPYYWWAPAALKNATGSTEIIAGKWKSYTGPAPDAYLVELFSKYGVSDPSAEELAAATAAKDKAVTASFVFANALSKRTGANFATTGHSAVDVSLFGYGPGHEDFIGNHDNTEVAFFVANKLKLDLKTISRKLQNEKEWIKDYVLPPAGKAKKSRRSLAMHHH